MSQAIATRVITIELFEGNEVYLTEQYHTDFKMTVLEAPRYGWRVKE